MENLGTMFLITLGALCLAVCNALPPFEIRSASSRRSEAAEDWMRQLQQYDNCQNKHGSSWTLSCSQEDGVTKMTDVQCVFIDQLCDGINHCPNGDDEMPFLCDALFSFLKLNREKSRQSRAEFNPASLYEQRLWKR